MKAAKSIQQAPRLPADVAALNEIACRAGIAVDVTIDGADAAITWRGEEPQLRATSLLRQSYHLPLRRGSFRVPEGYWFEEEIGRFYLDGEIRNEGGGRFCIESRIRLPEAIQEKGGVEIARWSDRISYFGEAEAMLAHGLIEPQQMPGTKQLRKRSREISAGNSDTPRWLTRKHPSGRLIHYRETDEAFRHRHEAERCRKEQEDREPAAQTEGQQRQENQRRLGALMRALPPFKEGSLTDVEINHLRVLRALSDRRWGVVLDFAERLLVVEGAELQQPETRARLRLVVDNDARHRGDPEPGPFAPRPAA